MRRRLHPYPGFSGIRVEAVESLARAGVRLPCVWNSSGYERIETLEEYQDLCDWALVDLRYSRDETDIAASQAAGYVEAARAAVKWAFWRRLARPADEETAPCACSPDIREIVAAIASLRGVTVEAMETTLDANAERLTAELRTR